jgi:hypothetical protein
MQMLSSNPGLPLDNKLLSWLPRQQMDLLVPHMTTKLLPQGTELLEAGEEFDHVYFPHRGMLSLLVVPARPSRLPRWDARASSAQWRA